MFWMIDVILVKLNIIYIFIELIILLNVFKGINVKIIEWFE